MKLDPQLKQDSGYAWVLSKLETASPFGSALARNPAWFGPGQECELAEELLRVEQALAWDGAHLETLIHLLSEFHDIRSSFHRHSNAPMDMVELFEVKHFLLRLERLETAYAPAPLSGVSIVPMDDMLALLDPSGRKLPPFHIEDSFDPALERIRMEKAQVEAQLRSEQNEELMRRRHDLVRQEDAAELNARRRLTTALLREKDRFLSTMDALGQLDLSVAKAKLARKYNCIKPEIGGTAVLLREMVHPQVAHSLAEKGTEFTPVSARLELGCTVVTGANMGGKSVAMKSIVLNLLLLHTGFFVFAEAMSSPLFHSVHLIGADGQSVEQGLSSFGAEVKQLDQVLRAEKGRFFFLALDEFARGTNPREGAALARALVSHLNTLNCIALMTTHYDGVADAARLHYQVAGLDERARKIDYRLILSPPDAPCPQDALKVCRLLDLDPVSLMMISTIWISKISLMNFLNFKKGK